MERILLLRRDGYTIHRANSGKEGLRVLAETPDIGVIMSDQRMPEMTGVEFLSQVKEIYPDTVRIVLSGYSDLNSITDAINQGAIYKFLSKPWDDEHIRENIKQAFEDYELKHENLRLTEALHQANQELESINQDLESRVEIKTREMMTNLRSLKFSQDVLDNLPVGVLGIADDGMIAVANSKAVELITGKSGVGIIGRYAKEALPDNLYNLLLNNNDAVKHEILDIGCKSNIDVYLSNMGKNSTARGWIIVMNDL
jgi:DNA-binding NtrC family response regulator